MKMRVAALGLTAGLALAAGAGACTGGGDETPAAGDATAVLTAVPTLQQGRFLVESEIAIGQSADASADSAHLFYAMTCVDDILTITTTKETVQAEMPCDRALTPEIIGRFSYLPVRIRVTPAAPAKLYFVSDLAGSVEFTVGRVWVESH